MTLREFLSTVRWFFDSADWGTWGQWVSGVSTAAGLLWILFKDLRKAPKLEITFEAHRDIATQGDTPASDGKSRWPRTRWVRVCVKNAEGRRVAKNGRAVIVGVKALTPSGWVNSRMGHVSRPTAWANDFHEIKTRDLHPGVSNWVDVAFTNAQSVGLFTNAEPKLSFPEAGDYLFAISVSAEESAVARFYLLVRWDGLNWESLTAMPAAAGCWAD